MIQVNGLEKKFGTFTAVDKISFNVNKGEVFGLLGENGAGKTTTLRMLATMHIIMGGGVEKFTKDLNENVTITLSQESDTAEARKLVQEKLIKDDSDLILVDVDDPAEALKTEQIRCILNFEKGFEGKLEKGIPFSITLQYDESKTKSQASVDIVTAAIEQFKAEVVGERIRALCKVV